MSIDHLLLAKCSQAAYEGKEAFKVLGFNKIIGLHSNKTKCAVYLAINTQELISVLAFRGTHTKADVWDDIKRFRVNTKNGWFVHSGFLERWSELKRQVIRMLRCVPTGHFLGVTGHSLGGALAALALAQDALWQARFGAIWNASCVTFGQPRVGGKNIAKTLSDLGVIRYVNEGDIVTKIPTLGYYHGGREVFLDRHLSLEYRWWSILGNHSIDSYVDRLGRQFDRNINKGS